MSTAERPAKRAKLLSDTSDSNDSEGEVEKASTNGFTVNEGYAKRFEHNKKREELQRLEEKYKKPSGSKRPGQSGTEDEEDDDEDSEDDESEDDDADLATKDVDEEIFATLQAIKNKDPRVYDEKVKFYKDFEADAEGVEKDGRAERPMYLQDYHRRNLLGGYTGDDEEDIDASSQTYQGEQDKMRRELVGSMHATANGTAADVSDEDDLLVAKSRPKHETVQPTQSAPQITEQDIAAADKDPDTYLSNFMAARAWLPTATSRWQAFDSDDSEDEERADAFEEAYNMRFEDPATANEKLQSFARDVGKYGVRREAKGSRRRARDREREDKEAARKEREEERARLRRLKIEEAEEKVKKIKDAAGLKGRELDVGVWRDVIEGDFDDEKWEAEMKRRFGDEYYDEDEQGEESDVDVNGGRKKQRLHKPQWDDDIDINDLVPDFEEDEQPAFTLSSDEEGNEESRKKSKTKKDRQKEKADAKRTARRERMQIEELVDASLPLSHPTLATSSTNNDGPSRGFRYRDTSPTSFGLSARDILFADDSQLNQYAGLKKMAAFRDAEKKRRDKKRYSKKARLREWRKETFGDKEEPKGGFERVLGGKGMAGEERGEEGGARGGDVVEGERKKRKRSGKKKAE